MTYLNYILGDLSGMGIFREEPGHTQYQHAETHGAES